MNALMKANEPGVLRGNFVLLRTDGVQLLLPQEEVMDATHLAPDRSHEDTGEVVALDRGLRPLPEVPAGRFVLTRVAGSPVSLAWDAVRVLIALDLPLHPVPPALRSPGSPIDGFVEIDGAPALCSSASALLAFAMEENA